MEKLLIKKKNKEEALHFIQAAICCNVLVFLSKSKYWKDLSKGKVIRDFQIKNSNQSAAYLSSFSALLVEGVVERSDNGYMLSELGQSLKEHIGLIKMLFEGYAPLMSKQGDIAINSFNKNFSSLINGKAIADASIIFGEETVDPIILDEFSQINVPGTVCDLGCGACTRLLKICSKTGYPGLGIDSFVQVIKEVQTELKLSNNTKVTCECGDLTKLKGIWEDITIAMQYFVFHDFTPTNKCLEILNSFLNNFPNLKYFFYVDIVAPSSSHPQIMPGYDYVHGLMGIKTRNYEETIQMFKDSHFSIVKERPIKDMPNTFLWILSPKNR